MILSKIAFYCQKKCFTVKKNFGDDRIEEKILTVRGVFDRTLSELLTVKKCFNILEN